MLDVGRVGVPLQRAAAAGLLRLQRLRLRRKVTFFGFWLPLGTRRGRATAGRPRWPRPTLILQCVDVLSPTPLSTWFVTPPDLWPLRASQLPPSSDAPPDGRCANSRPPRVARCKSSLRQVKVPEFVEDSILRGHRERQFDGQPVLSERISRSQWTPSASQRQGSQVRCQQCARPHPS